MTVAAERLEIRGISPRPIGRVDRGRDRGAHALAPLDDDRKAVMAARIERRDRARAQQAAHRVSRSRTRTFARTQITVQDARDGAFVGSEIPADLQRQWIQGTGPGREARRPGRRRASATSPTRCCPAPTAGCSTARTRSVRCRRCRWTTSATSSWPSIATRVHEGGRASGRRNEPVGAGVLRPRRSIADWQKQLDFTTKIFRPARSSPRRPAHPPRRRRRLLGLHRRRRRSSSSTTSGELRRSRLLARAVSAEDSDGRRGGALERHPRRARSAPGPADRHDQGLRARRAARGLLPADGDPRRARQALRRLQHRPLGLHQQRLRRDGVGSATSSTRTSTRSR